MGAPGFPSSNRTSFAYRELICGDAPIRSMSGVLLKGQNLLEGAVLGQIAGGANDGKLVLSKKAAADGSQTPICILAYDVDATNDDTACEGFIAGDIDQDAMILGTGHTIASVKAAFVKTPLFIKRVAGGAEVGGVVDAD